MCNKFSKISPSVRLSAELDKWVSFAWQLKRSFHIKNFALTLVFTKRLQVTGIWLIFWLLAASGHAQPLYFVAFLPLFLNSYSFVLFRSQEYCDPESATSHKMSSRSHYLIELSQISTEKNHWKTGIFFGHLWVSWRHPHFSQWLVWFVVHPTPEDIFQ